MRTWKTARPLKARSDSLNDNATCFDFGNARWLCSSAAVEGGPDEQEETQEIAWDVEKIIKPTLPSEPEKAQTGIEEADELYREIRVENVLTDEHGEKLRLKTGAKVDIVVKADTDATAKKPD